MDMWFQPAKAYMNKSKTIEELSGKIDVPFHNLKETIENWNTMAEKGIDSEFHRGENAYDHFTGDPFRKGHPNIEKIGPPFQAIQLHSGCLGTKMGPVTNEYGQTRLNSGEIVSGLYSIGNASASLFGNTYPGAGSPTSQCLVFGYRAGLHAAGAR
jgi:3-oxosteroid 1-dehydrogenase